MRGLTLLAATILTLTYGLLAQAAIAADLEATTRRAAMFAPPDTTGVLDAGTLAPIVVEAPMPDGAVGEPAGRPVHRGLPLTRAA